MKKWLIIGAVFTASLVLTWFGMGNAHAAEQKGLTWHGAGTTSTLSRPFPTNLTTMDGPPSRCTTTHGVEGCIEAGTITSVHAPSTVATDSENGPTGYLAVKWLVMAVWLLWLLGLYAGGKR